MTDFVAKTWIKSSLIEAIASKDHSQPKNFATYSRITPIHHRNCRDIFEKNMAQNEFHLIWPPNQGSNKLKSLPEAIQIVENIHKQRILPHIQGFRLYQQEIRQCNEQRKSRWSRGDPNSQKLFLKSATKLHANVSLESLEASQVLK